MIFHLQNNIRLLNKPILQFYKFGEGQLVTFEGSFIKLQDELVKRPNLELQTRNFTKRNLINSHKPEKKSSLDNTFSRQAG